MQRLFSMFPPGWPGLGLVLLRVAVAASGLLEAYGAREELSGWVLSALVLLSATLSVGFLTPMVAVLTPVVRLVGLNTISPGTVGFLAMTILCALALALLGPGAYSVDAYRFGRRVIVLPPPRNPDLL